MKEEPQRSVPRVLVLSGEIPQTRNAGGIVMWRLFAGYGEQTESAGDRRSKIGDGERPAVPTGDRRLEMEERESAKPAAAVDDRRSEIGDRSRTSSSELRSSASPSAKLFVIGPKAHSEAELLDCPYRELRMPLARLEKTRFSLHKRSLAALGMIPLPSHERVMKLLGEFKPEVVVCVMANTPWILTAERTARKLGIPLVLIVHDINEEFEKVFPWAKKALFRRNRDVYRSAARRLCVSPEMAEFLEERYGVPGEVMYPNRSEELQPRALDDSLVLRASIQRHKALGERQEEDRSDFDKGNLDILKNSPQASAPLTLGYAGSLAYGYGEALVELIPLLREVGAQILISTPRPPEKLKVLLEANDVVEWMPHRADINEMWRTMQERADVMILPYSNPAGAHELLYRTHFPSKLTEYLALGMPVVVSGPEFATGVKWALGEGREARGRRQEAPNFERDYFGILKRAPSGAVACTTREELVARLLRLKEDGELRRELARNGLEAGEKDFDAVRIRLEFQACLTHLSGNYKQP